MRMDRTTATTFSTQTLQTWRAAGKTAAAFAISSTRRTVKAARDIEPLVPAIAFRLVVLSLLHATGVRAEALGWS